MQLKKKVKIQHSYKKKTQLKKGKKMQLSHVWANSVCKGWADSAKWSISIMPCKKDF